MALDMYCNQEIGTGTRVSSILRLLSKNAEFHTNSAGLHFIAHHEPIGTLSSRGETSSVRLQDTAQEEMKRMLKADIFITCTGYRNKFEPIRAEIPVFKVGWIATDARGTLAKAAIEAANWVDQILTSVYRGKNLEDPVFLTNSKVDKNFLLRRHLLQQNVGCLLEKSFEELRPLTRFETI